MWVIGIVGRNSSILADRLERHLENMHVLADGTNGDMPLQTGILRCVDKFTERTKKTLRPNLMLIVVDPPASGTKNFGAIDRFSSHNPDYKWMPFWYQEKPAPDWDVFLSTESTFEDFAEAFRKLSSEPCEVQPEVARSPILTQSIFKTLNQMSDSPVIYRTNASPQSRQRNNLGEGDILSFTAVKGGTGKSTAALIGAALMTPYALDLNKRVLYLESNLGQPVAAARTWGKPPKDLMWVVTRVEEGSDPVEAVQQAIHPIGRSEEGVLGVDAVITSTTTPGWNERIAKYHDVMYSIACASAEIYDYVFIDMPPIDRSVRDDLTDRYVLPVSDKILMISDNDAAAAGNIFTFANTLITPYPGAEFPRDKMWFVLNKEGENTSFGMRQFEEIAKNVDSENHWQLTSGVPYSKELQTLTNSGISMTLQSTDVVSQAISGVLEEVYGLASGAILPKAKTKRKRFFGK